jgi:hypothetical protein
MSKCKYNYSSLMGKTKKNVGSGKGKNKKTKDLEDLIIEDQDLDIDLESETDSESDTNSETDSDSDSETSMSKELNSMFNDGIDTIKEGDMAMPAIGLGLIAIIGFALYKGIKV